MAYDSVPYTTFGGGINLRDQPDELAPGQAYDLLNVTFTERGGVKSRPGYDIFNVSTTLNGALTAGAATITVASTSAFPTPAATTLNGALTAGAATITVVSTTGFPTAGSIQIGAATVTYTGTTATTFTGCTGAPTASNGTAVNALVSIQIGSSTVTYTGKTATTFTGCAGAPAAANGTAVYDLAAYRADFMSAYNTGSAWQMAVSMTDGTNRRIEVRDASGAIVSGSTPLISGISASPNYFCQFGGGTASGNTRATPTLYASNGTDPLRVWTGSGSWSTPTWVITNSAPNPTGMFCAVTPWDNRLVNARYAPAVNPNQGGQNVNTVRFSSPTNPLAWDGYEYVDLTPGDGEEIMGMASYGSYVIVFKRTKFFVFYGTSQGGNSLGVPDFQFRTIDAGVGLAARESLCVAPDGIYFLSDKGIYRTDGGPPQLVSSLLDPLFTGELPLLYGGSAINYAQISRARMTFYRQQVLVALPTGSSTTNNTLLVFDPRFGWWSIWDIPCSALSPMQLSSVGGNLVFARATGSNIFGRSSASAVTDAGAAILSRIKYGFLDYGSSVDKTIRESQVWGLGKFRYAIARNLEGARNGDTLDLGKGTDTWADGNVATDTWGPDANYPNDVWSAGQTSNFTLSRRAIRGINFSLEFYNSADTVPGAWAVNRIVHRVRESRVPSVTKLDK